MPKSHPVWPVFGGTTLYTLEKVVGDFVFLLSSLPFSLYVSSSTFNSSVFWEIGLPGLFLFLSVKAGRKLFTAADVRVIKRIGKVNSHLVASVSQVANCKLFTELWTRRAWLLSPHFSRNLSNCTMSATAAKRRMNSSEIGVVKVRREIHFGSLETLFTNFPCCALQLFFEVVDVA